ncbi:MAG: NUDIX hydrolase [Cellulosilyticaceae bacterium]
MGFDMELWDLVDEHRQPLNKLHARQEPLAAGEYHIAVGIWTVSTDNEILVTLRHPEKEDYPDLWENTGGSILAGETSRAGAARELLEETGICVSEDELIFLHSVREKTAFMDAYMVRVDKSNVTLKMQQGETVAARWITLEALDRLMAEGNFVAPVAKRFEVLRPEIERLMREA